ncbi:MAG: OmpA family protein [Bacteroidales bacterium]|nr:OmpA family protein [Bacteroidales bacterium]
MMQKILTLIVILAASFFTNLAMSQNVEFDQKAFPNDKDGLKAALKSIKAGDKILNSEFPNYQQALTFYSEAFKFNPNNSILNYNIGYCYVKLRKYKDAIPYFESVLKSEPNFQGDIKFLLAKCYHIDYKFDEAIEMLINYRKTLTPDEISSYEKEIDKELAECRKGKELVNNPVRVIIENVGDKINTEFPDYSPVINADRSVLMFTSMRPTTTGGGIDEYRNQYFEDIYISQKDENGQWIAPQNPGKPLNSETHDAILGISADGQQLFLYRDEGGGDILFSKLSGDQWQKPENMGKNINSPYHESTASFSFDYLTIYFVSDRPGGYGGHDIYSSRKDEKGRWSPAQNMGGDINTPYEETGIFAHPDGKTFYFSSQGHQTMGGFDIFKITYENGKFSAPVNLGYPVNTTGDDVFFSISANGKYGYYSSSNKEGFGSHDIYQISFLGKEKELITNTEDNLIAFKNSGVQEKVIMQKVDIEEVNLMILKGTITDEYTNEVLFATLELTDLTTNKVVATFENNKSTGKYLVSLPGGKNYAITVNSDQCLFYSDNVDLSANTGYNEVVKDIQLKKIAVGSSVVLKNIFFDSGKSTLKPESEKELENLLKLLNEIPTLKIEISGHTDNVGSATFNKNLSEKRAKAVVDYLVGKGVNADRLTFVGYGFDQPKASNDTPEGRQENRRTEFKVLSR